MNTTPQHRPTARRRAQRFTAGRHGVRLAAGLFLTSAVVLPSAASAATPDVAPAPGAVNLDSAAVLELALADGALLEYCADRPLLPPCDAEALAALGVLDDEETAFLAVSAASLDSASGGVAAMQEVEPDPGLDPDPDPDPNPAPEPDPDPDPDPTDPVDPDPTDPVDPDPTDPVDPDPTDPTDPIEPDPTEPDPDPTEPEPEPEPTEPEEPADPGDEVEPPVSRPGPIEDVGAIPTPGGPVADAPVSSVHQAELIRRQQAAAAAAAQPPAQATQPAQLAQTGVGAPGLLAMAGAAAAAGLGLIGLSNRRRRGRHSA